MPSLTDIFTPSFFIFLGITTLLIALVIVYFENKMREQNHKIISMVSLVSAVTDELNIIRSNISLMNTVNYENIGGNMHNDKIIFTPSLKPTINPSKIISSNNLIEVSDDDSESSVESSNESETDDGEDIEDNDDLESSHDSSDDDSDISEINYDSNSKNEVIQIIEKTIVNKDIPDLKILKLKIETLEKTNDFKNESNLVFENLDNDDNQSNVVVVDEVNNDSNSLHENSEINLVSSSDLKTINIFEIADLEEFKQSNNDTHEIVEIKKMSLNKLRNLVAEKGLSNEVSKLKKNELLKLLGIE